MVYEIIPIYLGKIHPLSLHLKQLKGSLFLLLNCGSFKAFRKRKAAELPITDLLGQFQGLRIGIFFKGRTSIALSCQRILQFL